MYTYFILFTLLNSTYVEEKSEYKKKIRMKTIDSLNDNSSLCSQGHTFWCFWISIKDCKDANDVRTYTRNQSYMYSMYVGYVSLVFYSSMYRKRGTISTEFYISTELSVCICIKCFDVITDRFCGGSFLLDGGLYKQKHQPLNCLCTHFISLINYIEFIQFTV